MQSWEVWLVDESEPRLLGLLHAKDRAEAQARVALLAVGGRVAVLVDGGGPPIGCKTLTMSGASAQAC